MARVAARRQVALGQQATGVGAHQQRPVAPGADEVAVVPAALDHQVGEAERERAVGAGPHPQPDIGLAGEADMARVDDDQPHAALQRRDRRGRVGEAGEARVVAPQDQAAAVGDVRHRPAAAGADAADAIGVAGGEGAAPAAEVEMVIPFGVPKAFISRRMKPAESAIAVVEGEERLKATASGPCCSAIRRMAAAVRSSASSQLIRSQPGSGSPFGRVRRSGWVSRSG